MTKTAGKKPAPFIKWPGGKRAVAQTIARMAPPRFSVYWEPFLGGGAVFFHMAGAPEEERMGRARLSDTGAELINAYQVVRDRPGELIELLADHAHHHQREEDHYYQVRAMHRLEDPLEAAGRTLYLNATCFNGLYRLNRKGEFNVAKGSYKNPKICDPENIMAASRALRSAKIARADFEEAEPEEQDFVYCDPPHHGTYAGYNQDRFQADDQHRLRDRILRWAGEGAMVMCSNSDTPLIREAYREEPFRIHRIMAPRSISADGKTRGRVSELLITTYETGREETE